MITTTKLITTLPLLILFMNLPSAMHGNNTSGSENSAHQSVGGPVVELVLLERSPKQLKFQVKIKNTGERAVLIVSDPVRVDGSRGAYLSLDEHKPDLLEIAFAFFPLPIYTIYAPKHRVTTLRLDPGATHVEHVVWDEPFKDTKPPWGEWIDTKRINVENVRQVVAKVGVLPDDPAVHAALVHVDNPRGLERAESGPLKGKVLYEIQALVSSNIVKL
jgi:hypothetical protein